HWANVPQGKVYFLLSLKGGHNPGLTKLYDDDKKIKESHEELYSRAIKGESINQEFVDWLNSVFQKNEKNEILKEVNWKLYLTRPSEFEFTDNLKGIKKISNFYY
ncbi:MAG: hypothetical protein KDD45_15290, partial [Bdellovibrionales bacterium]|nr:hypothetical protein [Bdellovibrionales bacterium]